MDSSIKRELAERLEEAKKTGDPIPPLTNEYPEMTIQDAYDIQNINRGEILKTEELKGRKIGLTSRVMQDNFGVTEPDFGFISESLLTAEKKLGLREHNLIQPKIEAEIAFIMDRDISGPGVNFRDVLQHTYRVVPVFEIIDSRIRDWNIEIQDTIADNASCGLVIIGNGAADPDDIDLRTTGLILTCDGKLQDTAAGAEVFGHPAGSVAWLVNKMSEFDEGLKAGELVLSGSPVAAYKIKQGEFWEAEIGDIGRVTAAF
ncbi:2-keto-4-pentenoate hydratase [Halarsenatibacter silvermanii]|nr:fumarylacetoacetate hydrolase family protein [Halarsenatibacter silvermanii]